MVFFDVTPLGQILNLASKDLTIIDYDLASYFHNFITLFFQIIITFFLISANSIIILPFLIIYIIIIYFSIKTFIKISIDLKRLEQNAYSPIISNILEVYNGITVLREYNKMGYIKNIFIQNVDLLSNIYYHDNSLKVFLIILQLINGLLAWFSVYFIVLGKNLNWSFVIKDSNLIGLSLNYIFLSIMLFISNLLFFTEFLRSFTSVERIFRNIEDDLNEKNYKFPKPKKDWPKKGSIMAKGVNIRYQKHMPLVLKNVNFEIKSGEKIGVVGRTGSGKSTLILALSRILELDQEGKNNFISIDGVKTFSLGLDYIRKNLTVIPQDPFLLKGTLRFNIDPFNKYNDKTIIDVLKKCLIWDSNFFVKKKQENFNSFKIQEKEETNIYLNECLDKFLLLHTKRNSDLKKKKSDLEKEKLNYFIEDQGSNLSVGQKQLICIGRALIKKPKILLMDEATSSIDPNTDYKIQNILKNEFKDSTIITIAHRLNTIIFYDRIFFFDNGTIVEKGKPYDLLKKKESFFKKLILESGTEFYDKMLLSAKNKDLFNI